MYDDRMRALAYRCLGNRELMDDALQVAYIRCFKNLSSFRREANFGTWLNRIVCNVCYDMRAKAARVNEVPIDRIDNMAQERSFEEQLLERDRLQKALQTLPFDQRVVLILVDSQGLSYDETAEFLEIASGTVASRLHRARETLRQQLTSPSQDAQ